MKTLKENKNREEYNDKMKAFNEEFVDFITMEREAIKNLTHDELKEMRETMNNEIEELIEVKKKKYIELSMVVFLTIICIVSFCTPIFYLATFSIIGTLISLNRTIKKIIILNASILMYEDEFEIYYK